jgi:hypothetical protein
VFVFIVSFRKSVYHSSLGERSPTLHLTYAAHLVLYPNTLGTMCHFSLVMGVDIAVFFLYYFCCLLVKG